MWLVVNLDLGCKINTVGNGGTKPRSNFFRSYLCVFWLKLTRTWKFEKYKRKFGRILSQNKSNFMRLVWFSAICNKKILSKNTKIINLYIKLFIWTKRPKLAFPYRYIRQYLLNRVLSCFSTMYKGKIEEICDKDKTANFLKEYFYFP